MILLSFWLYFSIFKFFQPADTFNLFYSGFSLFPRFLDLFCNLSDIQIFPYLQAFLNLSGT